MPSANVAVEPSASTTSSAWMWSIVVPWTIDSLPDELLPIIPPSVARLDVDVSGPKPSPNRRAARLRSSWTTPGSTRTLCPEISSIAFMCRDVSITSPPPPAVWPARLVPPPRGITGTPRRPAIVTAAATSSASRGNATASGSTAYRLASPANRWRVYASSRTSPASSRPSVAASSPMNSLLPAPATV